MTLSRPSGLTGAVPGPPFLPSASAKSDFVTGRPVPDDRVATLDNIGQAMLKTMPHVIVDATFISFFSKANLDTLQSAIGVHVKVQSGYRINRQSDEKVLILMRRAFLNSLYTDASIGALNERVATEAAANIVTNIKFTKSQEQQREQPFVPLEYGVSDIESIRGTSSHREFM